VAHGADWQRVGELRVNGGLFKAGFSAVGLRGPGDLGGRGAAERKYAYAPNVVDLDEAAVGSGGGVVPGLAERAAIRFITLFVSYSERLKLRPLG
jgi:hypothetical protein